MMAHHDAVHINALSGRVIEAALEVSCTLGIGFLERVYENALSWELRERRIAHACQVPLEVRYKGRRVGDYVADLIVEDILIVEVKALSALVKAHRLQCLNYLRASDCPLGLLLNFGRSRLEIARVVHHL